MLGNTYGKGKEKEKQNSTRKKETNNLNEF